MRALYRKDKKREHYVWGIPCVSSFFLDEDVEQKLKEGWCKHPYDIPVISNDVKNNELKEFTRSELETLAGEYGVSIGKKSDKRLLNSILKAKKEGQE